MGERVYDMCDISIHALHEESDQASQYNYLIATFQSTLSMRRATAIACTRPYCETFQSTLSMRRAKCSWTFLSAF